MDYYHTINWILPKLNAQDKALVLLMADSAKEWQPHSSTGGTRHDEAERKEILLLLRWMFHYRPHGNTHGPARGLLDDDDNGPSHGNEQGSKVLQARRLVY